MAAMTGNGCSERGKSSIDNDTLKRFIPGGHFLFMFSYVTCSLVRFSVFIFTISNISFANEI